jgi:hypothetical protein
MNNIASMTLDFEREKNIKASLITVAICGALFLLIFMLQWSLP